MNKVSLQTTIRLHILCGRTFVSAPNQVLFTLGWVRIDLRPTRTNLLNPTSGRDASHPCLISFWSKEGCTVVCVIHFVGELSSRPPIKYCTPPTLASTPFLRPKAYKARVRGVSP